MYYRRGLEFGWALREVWPCPLIQVYEARMYSGKGDCRQGNYWWLKGIHDAGVKIWIATEKTYGAGSGEIREAEPDHVKQWFVRMAEFIPQVYKDYPFAARVLPGFHPWNTRLRRPNYLPRYLEDQPREAAATGYWLYNEGNASAGDTRSVLDPAFCLRYGIAPEDFLKVFARYPTDRAIRKPRP
ncbi:MAG: hypothetical protein IT210_21425 [Armatimonadetes bacterium]|nr:hypothetical protein [Armatimonadota bacterium]